MTQKNMQDIKPGNSNKITREYFDSLLIEMRHIDACVPSTDIELYSEFFSTPIMTAALSHLDNCCVNGAVEMAKGALAANALMWTGMGEDEELEKIVATGVKTIKIIKPHADNSVIFRKIEHAEKCGVVAMGMDIDHAFNSKGCHDNVLGLPMSPKTLEEIKDFIGATRLPFIIKGVLSVQDALICAEAGAKGVVVSHHHGIMDYAVPPLMILPEIVKEIGHIMPVFVDCGINSGYDAFKALALGASAVCVGRSLMGPLSDEGAKGVHRKIIETTQELSGVMARTCSKDIKHIDPAVIRSRQ